MKLTKVLIGIFAVIGLLSVIVVLVGAGYFLGKNNNIFGAPTEAQVTAADNKTADDNASADNNVAVGGTEIAENVSSGTASATDNASGEKSQTPTPTPSQSILAPSKTEFNITEEDYYLNSSNRIIYSDELKDFVKSFSAFENLTDSQLEKLIESKSFQESFERGKIYKSIQYCLEEDFNNSVITNYMLKTELHITVASNPSASNPSASNPSASEDNSGSSSSEYIPSDENLGGSEDNEAVDGEGYHAVDGSDSFDQTLSELNGTNGSNGSTGTTGSNVSTGITDSNEDILSKEEIGEDPNQPSTPSTDVSSESKYTFTPIHDVMYITKAVNYRQGPSTDYDKLGEFPAGADVYVQSQCNETGWYSILIYGGKTVYVSSKYLSATPLVTPTPSETPSQTPSQTPSETPSEYTTQTPTQTPTPTQKPSESQSQSQSGKLVTAVDGTQVELGKTYTRTITLTFFKLRPDATDTSHGERVTETFTCEGKYYVGEYKYNEIHKKEVWFVPDIFDESYDNFYLTACQYDAWLQRYPNAETKSSTAWITPEDYENNSWQSKYKSPNYDYDTLYYLDGIRPMYTLESFKIRPAGVKDFNLGMDETDYGVGFRE